MSEQKKKEKKIEEEWDKKKIIFSFVLVILMLLISYSIISSYTGVGKIEPKTSQSERINSGPNLKTSVQEQIRNIKNEAGSINLEEIASSSPQVQKIIKDLKSLQNLPQNELRNACNNICGKL